MLVPAFFKGLYKFLPELHGFNSEEEELDMGDLALLNVSRAYMENLIDSEMI